MLSLFPVMIISMSSCLLFSISPLSLGVWIIGITMMMTLTMSFHMLSWLPLIVFLIYIGGLLVMFSYFVAIQPNQQLGFFKMMTMLTIAFTYFSYLTNMTFLSYFYSLNMMLSPSIVLTNSNLMITLFLGMILFLALIAVVKISFSTKSPLRPFNYV